MAGGGYRLAVISVAAQFDGEDGHLEGSYVLVMPENETLPIVTGREWLGMPKFFADISSIRTMEDGSLRCEASLWGHLLFGIELQPPFKTQNMLIRKMAGLQATQNPAFGYKYISSLNGPPDADYPTVMWTDNTIDQLQLGKDGIFYLGSPTKHDIGEYQPVIEAIKTLPVLEIKQAAYSRGSMVLRNDKNGRIR